MAFSIFRPSQVSSAKAVGCYPRGFVSLLTVLNNSICETARLS